MLIALGRITRNPKQPRETFPPEHIEQLAASIKARGLLQPISVKPIGGDRFMIIAGECRFRAHQLLGADAIRAEVIDVSDDEMQKLAIIENLQRHSMNPIEEGRAFKSLRDQGLDDAQIMRELGLKSTALLHHRTQLLELSPDIQKLVASGQLAATMAWGVSLVSRGRQDEMLKAIRSGKLRTSEQVKAAGIALRDAEAQLDAFADAPVAAPGEVAAMTRLERKIAAITELVAAGFKDGECVAAQRVNPSRLETMADQLVLIRRHVLQMEHDLRRVATQTTLIETMRRGDNEDFKHQAAVGVADRQRPKGRRKQNVVDTVSRASSDPRQRKGGSRR